MSNGPLSRFRIALSVSLMSDLDRRAVVAGIEKVAPGSSLMTVPAIAASYGALVTKNAALQANIALVAADAQQLEHDQATRDASRLAFDVELVTLKTLVAQHAQASTDVSGMGFRQLVTVAAATQAPPAVPGPVLVKIGRQAGRARVVIGQPGHLPGSTVAELSPDPIGAATWTTLPGNGKERKIYGYPSGTRLWIRFAAVKYCQQSAWTPPVLITIP